MKKFTVTRLSELEPQDRFYFPKNKKKIFNYIGTDKEIIKGKVYFQYYDIDKKIITEYKDLKCVFLRNINDK